ncbi:DUF5763 domain-containing protein [Cnuella takakiae]|uniref:DUF5763 domain-containing protein n=1 Tax=Cnuella takakiae TaxID=1302690 RepID=UPI00373FD1BB
MKLLLLFLLLLTRLLQEPDVLLCISPDAHAYHNRQCQGLNRCTHSIRRVARSVAIRRRKDPCDFCYPSGDGAGLGSVQPVRPQAGGQCNATTQKGSRCSRSARSGGYCYQHGG